MPKKHSLRKRVKESRVFKSGSNIISRAGKNGSRSLQGTFLTYGKMSENLGGFYEVLAPGFADRSIQTIPVKAYLDHNPEKYFGVTGQNVTITRTNTGLDFKVSPLPQTSYVADALALADQGLIGSCSFALIVLEDDWSRTAPDGLPIRTVLQGEILEFSVLTGNDPAYGNKATTVSARALARAKRRDDDDCDEEDQDDEGNCPGDPDYQGDDDDDDEDRAACSCTCAQCIAQRCDRCLMESCSLEACAKNGCPAAGETEKLRLLLKVKQKRNVYDKMTTQELLAYTRAKLNR